MGKLATLWRGRPRDERGRPRDERGRPWEEGRPWKEGRPWEEGKALGSERKALTLNTKVNWLI